MTTEFNDRRNPDPVHFNQPEAQPLPTFKRRRRRPASDKGLPPDTDLASLAEAFLAEQRKLWPDLIGLGILPAPSPAVMAEMVQDFKARHRKGKAATTLPTALREYLNKLAGCYSRFSCDNSKTASIIDQVVNSLRAAKNNKEFIPWQYIFGDYSVSGLDSSRQGYTSYKSVLGDSAQRLLTTYIDDFTRASRDELEWWKLAHLSRKLKKNVVGASDGFSLNSEQGEWLMMLFNLLSKLFILAAAAESGIPPQRSNRSRLSSEAKTMINTLIRSGETTTAIVAKTGASRTTVNRERLTCVVAVRQSTTFNDPN